MKLFGTRLAAVVLAFASCAIIANADSKTFTNIEQMDRWHACSGCANAGGGATFSMTQHLSSPSLDGSSTKFSLGGTTPWSHALFYRWMSGDSTATHFVYDLHYYYKSA